MERKVICIILLSSLLITTGIPLSSSINPFPSFSKWITQNGLAAPGQTALPISISITNLYSTLALVNITFTSTFPFRIFNSTNGNYTFFIPKWNQGQILNFTLLLNIANNIKNGIYLENFTISSGTFVFKSSVQVPVLGYVNFDLQGIWGSLNQTLVAAKGETNLPLTIIIKNEGNVLASNVTILFNNSNSFPLYFYQEYSSIGFVPAGGFNVATNVANISSEARNGLYYIPVKIRYFNNSISNDYIPVYILGNVTFSLQSIWGSINQPILVSPGENNVPLTIIIKNLGNVIASNVTLYLKNQFPVMFYQHDVEVGYIPVGEASLITVFTSVYPNATSGLYYINITISYFKNQTTSSLLPVFISSPNISITAYTYPPQIFPGFFDVKLTVFIFDLSNVFANNATLTVKAPFQFVTPSSIRFGIIPAFKSLNFTFLFNVPDNISSGSYDVNITLSYDGGITTYIYPLEVYPKAKIEVTSISYSPLTPGSTNNLVIVTLKNIGNETAKNLKLFIQPNQVIFPHVSSSNPLMALTVSTIYVGDLRPNSSYNLGLVLDVSDGAIPGNYSIVITAVWNQTGSIYPFVENIKIGLSVSPTLEQRILTPSLFNIYFDLLLVIVIAIIATAIAFILRRRKK